MASSEEGEVIGELRDITECSICLKTFSDPRILPCIHTFCLKCLQATGSQCRKNPKDEMQCPICRRPFSVPSDSFTKLQKNFFMARLIQMTKQLQLGRGKARPVLQGNGEKTGKLEAIDENCKAGSCTDPVVTGSCHQFEEEEEDLEGEEDVEIIAQSEMKCDQHSAKLEVYCHNCQTLICYTCLVDDHQGHRGDKVGNVATDFLHEIENDIDKVSSYKELSRGLMRQSERQRQAAEKEFEDKEEEILCRSQELKDLIDRHTQSLLDELLSQRKERLKEMEMVKEESERYHTILNSFEAYCKEVVARGSLNDICRVKGQLHKRTKELEEMLKAVEIHSVTVFFEASDFKDYLTKDKKLIGTVKINREKIDPFQKSVFIIGSNSDQSTLSNTLKINTKSTTEISILDHQNTPAEVKGEVAISVASNILFVTGAGQNSNEIWKYHVVFGWHRCGSLVLGRRRHCVASLGDVLYICGGYVEDDQKILDSVEVFDIVTGKCASVGRLLHAVQNACCVPYSGSVYLFCGLNEDSVTAEHIQVYNALDNLCSLLSKPIPNPYNPTIAWRAVLWEKSVILLSRWTCFIFDLDMEMWTERKCLQAGVDNFGMVLENGMLLVIGGGVDEVDVDGNWKWICRDEVKFIPVTGLKRKSSMTCWETLTKLTSPALVFTCAMVAFPIE